LNHEDKGSEEPEAGLPVNQMPLEDIMNNTEVRGQTPPRWFRYSVNIGWYLSLIGYLGIFSYYAFNNDMEHSPVRQALLPLSVVVWASGIYVLRAFYERTANWLDFKLFHPKDYPD
jgi:hypothetical protein